MIDKNIDCQGKTDEEVRALLKARVAEAMADVIEASSKAIDNLERLGCGLVKDFRQDETPYRVPLDFLVAFLERAAKSYEPMRSTNRDPSMKHIKKYRKFLRV